MANGGSILECLEALLPLSSSAVADLCEEQGENDGTLMAKRKRGIKHELDRTKGAQQTACLTVTELTGSGGGVDPAPVGVPVIRFLLSCQSGCSQRLLLRLRLITLERLGPAAPRG